MNKASVNNRGREGDKVFQIIFYSRAAADPIKPCTPTLYHGGQTFTDKPSDKQGK